jgi:hypothetical protein
LITLLGDVVSLAELDSCIEVVGGDVGVLGRSSSNPNVCGDVSMVVPMIGFCSAGSGGRTDIAYGCDDANVSVRYAVCGV